MTTALVNPISTGAKWALGIGATMLLGVGAWALWPKKAAAAMTPGAGQPAAALLTDPTGVQAAKNMLSSELGKLGLTYTSDGTGDPKSQAFMDALGIFQATVNSKGDPAKFATQNVQLPLRKDGVLDWNTYRALVSAGYAGL